MTEKKMEIIFAPGAFDSFDGTQEELDEMIAEIQRMVESGEISEHSHEITEEDFNELPDEIKQQLVHGIDVDVKRNLQ